MLTADTIPLCKDFSFFSLVCLEDADAVAMGAFNCSIVTGIEYIIHHKHVFVNTFLKKIKK